MQPDALRRLACLIREGRLSHEDRQEWAEKLVALASELERPSVEQRARELGYSARAEWKKERTLR